MKYSIDQTLDKKSLTSNLKSVYNKVYHEHEYHPVNSKGCWSIIRVLYPWFTEALDVGCGIGYGIEETRKQGKNVYGCDISNLTNYWKKLGIDKYCEVAPAHKMPYRSGRFDLVVCSDVLEHVPEKLVDDTLAELYRVGNACYFFHICSREEISKNNLREQGIVQLHITIKPDEWWKEKIEQHGFKVLGMVNYEKEPWLVDITAIKDTAVDRFTTGTRKVHIGPPPKVHIIQA